VHRLARHVEAPRHLHHLDSIADHREHRAPGVSAVQKSEEYSTVPNDAFDDVAM